MSPLRLCVCCGLGRQMAAFLYCRQETGNFGSGFADLGEVAKLCEGKKERSAEIRARRIGVFE